LTTLFIVVNSMKETDDLNLMWLLDFKVNSLFNGEETTSNGQSVSTNSDSSETSISSTDQIVLVTNTKIPDPIISPDTNSSKSSIGVSVSPSDDRDKEQDSCPTSSTNTSPIITDPPGSLDGMVVLSQDGMSSTPNGTQRGEGRKRYFAVMHEDDLYGEVANFECIDDGSAKRGVRRQNNCIKDANGDIITDQTGKPLCTYTELIEKALRDTGGLTVSEIYTWIS